MMAEVSDIRALTGPTAWRPFLTALLATGLASCGGPPESSEQQLRAWVDRGHEAAERKDRSALVEMISPTYSDARGNSRDDIENLFRFYFLRAKNVGLLVGIDDIEIFDDSAARVMLTVAMGATTDAVLGFNADAYEFELDLENAGGEWLLVSGRWTDVGNELR
ncbi:MAG: hypothetical protein OEV03_04030 [Gammaproteobacteria bacterium]|jgi:hypothetical protein|nr:hypothetical protein [Gammaproteobacteria bacterium]NCF58509.1 hypothetical protein [Gammaproteobacteria bacterium]